MEVAVPKVLEISWGSDALQAVKLDPAVLEAKITVDRNTKTSNAEQGSASNVNEHQATTKPYENYNQSSKSSKFDDLMRMQKAAVLSLTPHQFDLLLRYCDILRKQRTTNQKNLECAFCKNNGEPASWYSIHMLRDREGRVRCPVLRGYRCRGCGATGDRAHTIKYCPLTDRDRWSF